MTVGKNITDIGLIHFTFKVVFFPPRNFCRYQDLRLKKHQQIVYYCFVCFVFFSLLYQWWGLSCGKINLNWRQGNKHFPRTTKSFKLGQRFRSWWMSDVNLTVYSFLLPLEPLSTQHVFKQRTSSTKNITKKMNLWMGTKRGLGLLQENTLNRWDLISYVFYIHF